jgi:outer membrane protein
MVVRGRFSRLYQGVAWLAIATAQLFSALEVCEAKQLAVAVVDIQKVLSESVVGKAARSDLEARLKKGQLRVSEAQADFDRLRSEFEKQLSVLSAAARDEKREALSKKQLELQRLSEDLRADLARRNEAAMARVGRRIQGVVDTIAREKGYSFVLERDKQMVVFASERIDITADVIEVLDTREVEAGSSEPE